MLTRPLGLLLLAGSLAAAGAAVAQEPARPLNVLLIVCDDLNNNLGCYGHPVVQSPHIDRLAVQGVRFDRAYCQYPICNPSRTSFLSGHRPGAKPKALEQAVWLPRYFQERGYVVADVSKVAHTPVMAARCGFPPREKNVSAVAGRAVELMEKHKDRPFFLAVGLTYTHPGFSSTPQFAKLYPADGIQLPQEPADIRKQLPGIAFEGVLTQQLTDPDRRRHIASYYAAISTLDAQVGVLLDGLDRLQLRSRTVVVFISDHGRHLGEHGGIYDKRSLFEKSVRVPLIVSAPGRQAKVASPRLVELVDLYPTLAELCGLPNPKEVEGTSFVPLLDKPEREWKKAAFSVSAVSGKPGRSVRTERYRYSDWGNDATAMLFDHDQDPHEHVNLAADPKHAETLAQMRRLLTDGWQSVRLTDPATRPPK